MEQEELKEILSKHELWVSGKEGGKRANLLGADLMEAYLLGAGLMEAYLEEADLTGAYSREADLTGVDLTGVILGA